MNFIVDPKMLQYGIFQELMKLMGLQSWMLWIGWLFHALVSNLLSITVIVILLKMPWSSDEGSVPVIQHCSGIILWLFLTLYVITGICFCFFLSTLFQRRKFQFRSYITFSKKKQWPH